MSSALNKKTVEDIEVSGKRVLVRCDFNVKMENGVITSDKRIVASLPTIKYLIEKGAKVILCSHLGRPHSSTAGVADYLPSAVGYLIQKEIKFIGGALENPVRPLVAILGGAKVSDKIGVITNLLDKCDTVIIGGGMAYTFFAAQGYSIGTSLLDSENIENARAMMAKAKEKGVNFLLPVDNVIADKYDENAQYMTIYSDSIPDGWMGLDIGPVTSELYAKSIKHAGTVIWNGPMGVSEWEHFANGTVSVAKGIADSNAISIIGGGDSAAAVKKLGFADKMSHISTGGGASLEFLEGKVLPGVAAADDK